MFENIGKKIKGLAKVLFWLEATVAVVGGLALMEDTYGESLLYMVIGVLVVWVSSWFLYGFGEIIDKLCEIERNTRGTERKSDAQTKADYERVSKIEKLRSQGLITEEEYQQVLSRKQQEEGQDDA